MRLISFDVGIKNMSYCIFDISGSRVNISNWGILNLLNETTEKPTCNGMCKPKTKRDTAKICGRVAKYSKGELIFCEKHAKMSEFMLPTKECSPISLKKLKIDDLKQMIQRHSVPIGSGVSSKKDLMDTLNSYFSNRCLENIVNKKGKNSSEIDLIMIGRNMKLRLDEIPDISSVTHVIIENQISPIANRMKTIQGMLAQYFIMTNPGIHIEFISSANKLSELKKTKKTGEGIAAVAATQNEIYKEHKKDSVTLCSQILDKNAGFSEWKYVLENRKKIDDLADAFLQGVWYLRNKVKVDIIS